MGEAWRLIRGTGRPAENMALDLAMTWAVGEGRVPPTLRLYRWDPPAVSVGYAQRGAVALDLEACARAGLAVVRRPTGGRAVLHAGDLSYALAVPRRGVWARLSVAATCRRIHEGVGAGLSRLGVCAEVVGPRPPQGVRRGDGAALCFAAVSSHEITVAGRKLVGSAQRRVPGAILQHGSIALAAERARLAALLPGDGGTALRVLEETMVSLAEILGRPPDPEAVGAAVSRGFAETFGIRLTEASWHPAERALAARLEGEWPAADEPFGNGADPFRYRSVPVDTPWCV